MVFAPFIFAVLAVVAGTWAHNVFYHEVLVPALCANGHAGTLNKLLFTLL